MICSRCNKPMRPVEDRGIRKWHCQSCYHHSAGSAAKEADHITIDKDVAAFLAKGGKIKQIDHTDNYSFNQPVKRTRKEQVKHNKRFNLMMG